MKLSLFYNKDHQAGPGWLELGRDVLYSITPAENKRYKNPADLVRL